MHKKDKKNFEKIQTKTRKPIGPVHAWYKSIRRVFAYLSIPIKYLRKSVSVLMNEYAQFMVHLAENLLRPYHLHNIFSTNEITIIYKVLEITLTILFKLWLFRCISIPLIKWHKILLCDFRV